MKKSKSKGKEYQIGYGAGKSMKTRTPKSGVGIDGKRNDYKVDLPDGSKFWSGDIKKKY